MRTSFRIIRNTLTTWTAITVNIIISILLVPFLLNKLGIEAYGLIALAVVLISVSILADMGIQASLTRNLAEKSTTGNTRECNQLLSSGLILYLFIGIVFAGMCVLFSASLADLFKVSPAIKKEAVSLIRYYVGPAVFISFLKPVFISILSSNNRFDIIHAVHTGMSIFRGAGILIVLSFPDTGLYEWAFISLAAQFFALLFFYKYARKLRPGFIFHIRCVKISALRELFSTGKYIFVQQVSLIFRHRINTIILSIFLGPSAAALYRPAESISLIIKPVINTLAAQIFPLTTGYHAAENIAKLKAVLIRGTRYTLLLAIPVSVMFIVFHQPLIRIWLERSVGQKYLVTSSVLFYMAIVDFFLYAGGTQGAVLLGMNKIKFTSMVSAAFTALSFASAVILVGFTSIGIIGVVLPAVFTGAVTRVIFIIHSARRCHISVKTYLRQSYLKPGLIFLILWFTATLSRFLFLPERMWMLLLNAIGIIVIWAILCWTVGFERNDKQEFIYLAKSLFGKAVGKPPPAPYIRPLMD